MALVAPALIGLAAHAALAQPRKIAPQAPARAHAPPSRPAAKKVTLGNDGGPAAPVIGAPAVAGSPSAPDVAAATDAGVVETKTLDGGTRVFKFSELDIEGHLKSPQLVYFLRRVRAEFAAGDLGHRSFLREMSQTRKEPTF